MDYPVYRCTTCGDGRVTVAYGQVVSGQYNLYYVCEKCRIKSEIGSTPNNDPEYNKHQEQVKASQAKRKWKMQWIAKRKEDNPKIDKLGEIDQMPF